MKIFGIEIIQPHSGAVTRATALGLLKKEAEYNFSRRDLSYREMCAVLIKRGFTSLVIEDVNGGFRAELAYW